MNRSLAKKSFVGLLLLLLCALVPLGAYAAELTPVKSNNVWDHSYSRYASPAKSYLTATSSGNLQRVEYTSNQLIVEEYSTDYSLISQRTIDASTYTPSDLASDDNFCWGGFYEGSSSYFVVTGQTNSSESDSLCVVRVTKYSKNWKYEGNCEFSGINTYIPFDAGSLDCVELNGVLYVRTCHEMYKSSDGYHHQANMTLLVNESDMTRAGGEWQVGNIGTSYGYVSHSFNQYITAYNGSLYAVDHGDAYPRAINLKKLGGSYTKLLSITGEIGDNTTSATVGGFESSSTCNTLLTVGSSADQSAGATTSEVAKLAKNAWLSVSDASGLSSKFIWLSDYASDSLTGVNNPHLVKINENKFLIMWGVTQKESASSRSNNESQFTYMMVDGNGNTLQAAKTVRGELSDVAPVLANGKAVWYTTGEYASIYWSDTDYTTAPQFYAIDVSAGSYDNERSLALADIELSGSSPVYSGKAQEPSFEVTLGGKKLVQGTDYTVAFENNVNAGEATATFTGKGNYFGYQAVTFTIDKATISDSDIQEAFVYDGKEHCPLTQGVASYSWGTSKASDAGNYTVSVNLDDNHQFSDGRSWGYVSWKITPATLTARYVSETVVEGQSPAYRVEVTGFVNGETAATAKEYVAPHVDAWEVDWYGSAAGSSYVLTPDDGSAANYTFEYVAGTLKFVTQDEYNDNPDGNGDSSDSGNNGGSDNGGNNGGTDNSTDNGNSGNNSGAQTGASVSRLAGENADQTSVAISQATFAQSDWVILARMDDFADAMSATGLAGLLDAPILLTDRYSLSECTAQEIERLQAKSVYIIGGWGAMPGDFESALKAIGVANVGRIYGTEYYDTSVECATQIAKYGGDADLSRAIIAYGQNFQDALSISSFAYKYHVPIFLQTPGETSAERALPQEALSMLSTGQFAGAALYVTGGNGAVSFDSVERVFGDKLRGGVRIWGETGYDTSNQIASYMLTENLLSADTVCIATGAEAAKGVDALAGAALAGKAGGVMLLASAQSAMEADNYATITGGDSNWQASFLEANASSVKSCYILGGTYVLPDTFRATVDGLLS